jgi:hypothetical protein
VTTQGAGIGPYSSCKRHSDFGVVTLKLALQLRSMEVMVLLVNPDFFLFIILLKGVGIVMHGVGK